MDNLTDDVVRDIAARRWGLSPRRRGREWHSSCPVCGGDGRFIIFADGGYWCRLCHLHGWLDDDKPHYKPDPLLLARQSDEIARRRREQEERDRAWSSGYSAGYWQGWHDAMQSVHRAWWYARGIGDQLIDTYGLGYCADKRIRTRDGVEIVVPAYTIPVRNPRTWEVIGMHYRLAEPPPGVGKYRYERGITARAFYAAPGEVSGTALVVEGAIKAIVCYDRLGGRVQVVGLPGCSPGVVVREELRGYSRIYLALDPGAEAAAERLRAELPQVRIVHLPGKPDDMFLSGAMTVGRMREYIRQAR